MIIEDLLEKQHMTKYKLAVQAGIPHATLSDICSGKTKLEKCSAETIYKLAKALKVPMELLTGNLNGKNLMNTDFRNIYSMIWMNIKKG